MAAPAAVGSHGSSSSFWPRRKREAILAVSAGEGVGAIQVLGCQGGARQPGKGGGQFRRCRCAGLIGARDAFGSGKIFTARSARARVLISETGWAAATSSSARESSSARFTAGAPRRVPASAASRTRRSKRPPVLLAMARTVSAALAPVAEAEGDLEMLCGGCHLVEILDVCDRSGTRSIAAGGRVL